MYYIIQQCGHAISVIMFKNIKYLVKAGYT